MSMRFVNVIFVLASVGIVFALVSCTIRVTPDGAKDVVVDPQAVQAVVEVLAEK